MENCRTRSVPPRSQVGHPVVGQLALRQVRGDLLGRALVDDGLVGGRDEWRGGAVRGRGRARRRRRSPVGVARVPYRSGWRRARTVEAGGRRRAADGAVVGVADGCGSPDHAEQAVERRRAPRRRARAPGPAGSARTGSGSASRAAWPVGAMPVGGRYQRGGRRPPSHDGGRFFATRRPASSQPRGAAEAGRRPRATGRTRSRPPRAWSSRGASRRTHAGRARAAARRRSSSGGPSASPASSPVTGPASAAHHGCGSTPSSSARRARPPRTVAGGRLGRRAPTGGSVTGAQDAPSDAADHAEHHADHEPAEVEADQAADRDRGGQDPVEDPLARREQQQQAAQHSRISGISQPRNSCGTKVTLIPPRVMCPLKKYARPDRIVKKRTPEGPAAAPAPEASASPGRRRCPPVRCCRRWSRAPPALVHATRSGSASVAARRTVGPATVAAGPTPVARSTREALFAVGADVHVQAVQFERTGAGRPGHLLEVVDVHGLRLLAEVGRQADCATSGPPVRVEASWPMVMLPNVASPVSEVMPIIRSVACTGLPALRPARITRLTRVPGTTTDWHRLVRWRSWIPETATGWLCAVSDGSGTMTPLREVDGPARRAATANPPYWTKPVPSSSVGGDLERRAGDRERRGDAHRWRYRSPSGPRRPPPGSVRRRTAAIWCGPAPDCLAHPSQDPPQGSRTRTTRWPSGRGVVDWMRCAATNVRDAEPSTASTSCVRPMVPPSGTRFKAACY